MGSSCQVCSAEWRKDSYKDGTAFQSPDEEVNQLQREGVRWMILAFKTISNVMPGNYPHAYVYMSTQGMLHVLSEMEAAVGIREGP